MTFLRVKIMFPKHDFKSQSAWKSHFINNHLKSCFENTTLENTISTVKIVSSKHNFKKKIVCQIISKQYQFN